MSTNTATYTIIKAQANVSWSTTTIYYNGQDQAPVPTAKGAKNENIQLSVSGKQTNAGSGYTATVVISGSQAQNYYLNEATTSKTYSIAKKPVSAVWGTSTFTYDKQSHLPTATAQGVTKDGKITLNVSGAQTNVGDYQATASLPVEFANNYTLNNTSHAFYITKATVNVSWSNLEFTYDKTSHLPIATATGVGGESVSISISGAQVNAGSHTATATTSNNNYKLGNATVSFVINKAKLTIVWPTNTEFIYDGNQKHFNATSYTGKIGDDAITFTYTYYMVNQVQASAPTQTGSYRVVVSTNNQNYEITNAEATFTIVNANA